MSRKYGTLTSQFLSAVGEATGFFSWPPEGSSEWINKQLQNRKRFYDLYGTLKRKKFIQEIKKNGKKFLKLTAKGELEMLIAKAGIEKGKDWDGFWRLIIFDIPEDCRDKRDQLRLLLKRHGFVKLQGSVFINPYPLNREAISYLKQSGLIDYIRIMKVSEMDDDSDLRKKFNL